MLNYIIKKIPFFILIIAINSIIQWCSLPLDNTYVWWTIDFLMIYTFWSIIRIKKKEGIRFQVIDLFFIMLILSALYGAIWMAKDYWAYKLLVGNFLIFSLPLASYYFEDPKVLSPIIKVYVKYSLLILLILSPFLTGNAFGKYLVPFSFLSLFWISIKKQYKILILIAYLITIILGNDSRSDMLKFSITLLLGTSVLFNHQMLTKIIRLFQLIFFISPVILFILALNGKFNIFNIQDYISDTYAIKSRTTGEDMSLTQDTRTFLYVEEIESAIANNYVVWGRSPAKGYYSRTFAKRYDEYFNRNTGERPSSEVSILNIFNYFGLIGVFLYSIMFLRASYLAIYKSNNIYIKIVGLYISFRWFFAWIEDFSRFDLNYLFLWIMIGMCFSYKYRSFDNSQFYGWIRKL